MEIKSIYLNNGFVDKWSNGDKYWYINGKDLIEEEFNNRYDGKII